MTEGLTVKKYLWSYIATVLLAGSLLAEDQPPSIDELRSHPEVMGALAIIDAWVEGRQLYDRIPGVSVGIVSDQDMLWSAGYGHANVEDKVPADEDTLYSICSISKLFTAISIMQLRDQGQLNLNDSVNQHLDWFQIRQAYEHSGPITIESLLTHSSGLPRESDFPYWVGPDFPFPTREQMIARLDDQETLYPSQYYFQYSNLALSLAGEIIQEVSGTDYNDYIVDNILQPLGMGDTRTYYPESLRGRQMSIGYTGIHREQARTPVKPLFARGITAAAGFTSSVNDLAAFASWQFGLLDNNNDEVLAANSLREMHRVHWVDPDWETTWGIGFNVRKDDDLTIVSHGGGCPGYITSFSMVPKQKMAAIVLTNAGDGAAGNLAVNILKTIGPALKKASGDEPEEMPDFARYEGNYESRPWGGEVAVRQWGDKLVVMDLPSSTLKDAMIRLEHDGDDQFTRLTDDDDRREAWTFEFDDAGPATRVRHHSSLLTRID
jgi:CubicO group peptidase (beta-lactamase class C family)